MQRTNQQQLWNEYFTKEILFSQTTHFSLSISLVPGSYIPLVLAKLLNISFQPEISTSLLVGYVNPAHSLWNWKRCLLTSPWDSTASIKEVYPFYALVKYSLVNCACAMLMISSGSGKYFNQKSAWGCFELHFRLCLITHFWDPQRVWVSLWGLKIQDRSFRHCKEGVGPSVLHLSSTLALSLSDLTLHLMFSPQLNL